MWWWFPVWCLCRPVVSIPPPLPPTHHELLPKFVYLQCGGGSLFGVCAVLSYLYHPPPPTHHELLPKFVYLQCGGGSCLTFARSCHIYTPPLPPPPHLTISSFLSLSISSVAVVPCLAFASPVVSIPPPPPPTHHELLPKFVYLQCGGGALFGVCAVLSYLFQLPRQFLHLGDRHHEFLLLLVKQGPHALQLCVCKFKFNSLLSISTAKLISSKCFYKALHTAVLVFSYFLQIQTLY